MNGTHFKYNQMNLLLENGLMKLQNVLNEQAYF